ncbi:putative pancreatic lipase-related protein 2 isoform X2 [Apostichopus japonicus]|uniref:Putative pancreatic lipase-related protein 2 isoform X2 n=2 Tax=Stichopus japonicus TaxID=307972 RepID=A0A2G8LPG1_STIJA|nr:putative pancreatic lipase-related protein 2 isoform X2 [Apostichopus japonicus]
MLAFMLLAIAASATASTEYYNGFTLDNSLSCHEMAWPPMTEAEIGTTFYMYTPSTPNGVAVESGDLGKMERYGFDDSKKTHFYTHGYLSTYQFANSPDIYQGWINQEGANVFAVDWRNGAAVANYNYARQNIRVVGNQIAIFAEALGQSFSKIELAGHSLGSHASGYAGEALKNKGHTVSRITGLDPAGPGFSSQSDSRCRLDPSDADFVDNIHTDDDTYGSSTDMGHVDFYPNGGSKQPNCISDVAACSHNRVIDLYAESVEASSCKFTSYACSSWADYEAGQCTSCGGIFGCCNYMGYWATASCTGKRYLETNGRSQYCIS